MSPAAATVGPEGFSNDESGLRLLMDNVPASIGYFDRQLTLRHLNREFERVFQRPAAQLVGSHLSDVVGAAIYPEVAGHFQRALRGEGSSYRRSAPQGAGRPALSLRVRVVPHRDGAGDVVGCFGVAIDTTDSERAEAERRNLQTLFTSTFENTSDLMAVYRVDGAALRIEEFNRALRRFYAERWDLPDLDAWIGRDAAEFLAEVHRLPESEIARRLAVFRRAIDSRELVGQQVRVPTPRGDQWRDTLLIPLQDDAGRVTHLFYRAADITETQRKEQRLQTDKALLEREVAARTAELIAANRELEAFTYAVSHDLRTPLRGIDGFSRLLEEDLGERLDADCAGHVRRIRASVTRMAGLIDDLLRLSQTALAPLSRGEVDLSALAHEIAAELGRDNGRQVEWRIAEGMRARADAGHMRLMFANLLGNAYKYTLQREVARIDVASQSVEGGVEISVRDNGAGFDMRYAGRLFQPFERLHRADEFEGSGIGLATVKRIVDRHGGRIAAQGEPHRGATFRVFLPEV
jgi:PAS domain S-box-containing protein